LDFQIKTLIIRPQRIDLPFELLSDEEGELGAALRLPTFVVEGRDLYKRLTVVLNDGKVEKVFYPIFPPDKHAQEVLAWLKSTSSK
jgi:peroxiredoxin